MSKVTESVYELVKPIAEQLGYELVEVQYDKKYNGMNLTLIIDKEEGIDINDCEKLHHAVDAPLDELNPTQDKGYILNVSSPGLDRPLTLARDFLKNMNKEIIVKLYAPLNGKKQFVGELVEYNEPLFSIICDGQKIEFDRTKTAGIVPFIKF